MHRRGFPRGFTILESFVILAILAILTMLVVALIQYRTRARIPSQLQPPPAKTAPAGDGETGARTKEPERLKL